MGVGKGGLGIVFVGGSGVGDLAPYVCCDVFFRFGFEGNERIVVMFELERSMEGVARYGHPYIDLILFDQ